MNQSFRCLLLSVSMAYGAGTAAADEIAPPSTDKLNQPITGLQLTTAAGRTVGLAESADAKAVAIVFLSFDCPVSNSYAPTLSKLADTYKKQGLRLVGVVAGEIEPGSLEKWAKEFRLTFPLLADPKLAAADALKATTTPEAFVIDAHGILRYRGRIDDAYSARLKRNAVVSDTNLDAAIAAVLAGKPVPVPATAAIGCPIGDRELIAKPGADTSVAFYSHVLPILQKNCQGCHRPGQVGPFSLITYRQAVNWAEDIKAYTASREMPPWKPTDGPAYQDDRRMSDKEIATLAAWVDAACPEGEPADAPPAPTYSDGWGRGEPDLVLEVAEDFHLGASGVDLFRCFVLPTGLTEDKYIVGYEVQPGNTRIVHHTLNFWDRTGMARKLEADQAKARKADDKDYGPGYSSRMGIGFYPVKPADRPDVKPTGAVGGWAPGQQPVQLPEGYGWLLPKGADLLIQTHYHRTGKPETDRLKIGLYFAKNPEQIKDWQSIVITGIKPSFFKPAIPAGKPDHDVKGSVWLRTDAKIYNVMPHMHLLGRSVKITMTPPDGQPVTLVDVPDWDYNWQETYWFRQPIMATEGTRLDIEATYDNSARNPNNPFSPPRDIYFGEQTTNEMLFGFLGATPVNSPRVRVTRDGPPK